MIVAILGGERASYDAAPGEKLLAQDCLNNRD